MSAALSPMSSTRTTRASGLVRSRHMPLPLTFSAGLPKEVPSSTSGKRSPILTTSDHSGIPPRLPLLEPEAPLQPRERNWSPPIELAEEAHQRGHEERAHDRRVDEHADGLADGDLLHEEDGADREGDE